MFHTPGTVRTYHDVHASQLRPDLSEDTNVNAVDHVGLEQLHEGNVGVLAFKLDHLTNLIKLKLHEGTVGVTLAVNQGKNGLCLLPSVVTGEPTRRFRQKQETNTKDDSRNHLQTPRNTEGLGAFHEAAAVGDVVHN